MAVKTIRLHLHTISYLCVLFPGDFTVARSRNSFARVAVDHAIEQTVNRDTKTKGGIIGFSRNDGSVHRWILTAHERAAMTNACKSLATVSEHTEELSHKDQSRPRVKRDEQDVQRMAALLTRWGNPFLGEGIVSLSSRFAASSDLQRDLLQAFDVGNSSVERFVRERITSDELSFFDPLPSHKLLTYSTKEKTHSRSKSNVSAVQLMYLYV